MGEMTLDSVNSTGVVKPDFKTVKKNLEAEVQEEGVDKE